jgi:hypothetical protein
MAFVFGKGEKVMGGYYDRSTHDKKNSRSDKTGLDDKKLCNGKRKSPSQLFISYPDLSSSNKRLSQISKVAVPLWLMCKDITKVRLDAIHLAPP